MTIGNHPAGSGGTPRSCPDTMLLPPQSEGRRLRCQRPAGHEGHHRALDPDGRVQRTWPQTSTDRHLQAARSAAGATPKEKP